MKIYFAGAIRGGRKDARIYNKIIKYLTKHGSVLTEHVGTAELDFMGEKSRTDENIFNRDMNWLRTSDLVVAEVTVPSLGVGYELGIAEKLKKPVLCLYRSSEDNHLSAMLNGNNYFFCKEYNNLRDAKFYIDEFIKNLHLAK